MSLKFASIKDGTFLPGLLKCCMPEDWLGTADIVIFLLKSLYGWGTLWDMPCAMDPAAEKPAPW